MNRIIKFRVWDKAEKRMIPWDEIQRWKIYEIFEDFLLPLEFTGLLDKNGKEIYESDWVRAGGTLFTVIWHKQGACFRYYDGFDTESPMNYDDTEVIGNIYENPNLLERK